MSQISSKKAHSSAAKSKNFRKKMNVWDIFSVLHFMPSLPFVKFKPF
jgi:hypothetical protein